MLTLSALLSSPRRIRARSPQRTPARTISPGSLMLTSRNFIQAKIESGYAFRGAAVLVGAPPIMRYHRGGLVARHCLDRGVYSTTNGRARPTRSDSSPCNNEYYREHRDNRRQTPKNLHSFILGLDRTPWVGGALGESDRRRRLSEQSGRWIKPAESDRIVL